MLEIGTSGLMSGEGKRVVIGLYTSELIPRLSSTLPNLWARHGGGQQPLRPSGVAVWRELPTSALAPAAAICASDAIVIS